MLTLPPSKTYVIAEAGVNHNGDIARAIDMVAAGADAGADAVKFQTFDPAALVTADAAKVAYQLANTGDGESQHAMLERLVLKREDHGVLIDACKKHGVDFISTPFDHSSLAFLAHDLDLPTLKFSSGDATNGPLLLAAAQTSKTMILSTGMCTLNDIERALDVIAWGMTGGDTPISIDAIAGHRDTPDGCAALLQRLAILHCVTDYPAPPPSTNLNAMITMSLHFELTTGFSDHSIGTAISIGAVAMGAAIIEKHFTLDRNLPGPDHAASLMPDELKHMIDGIRDVEVALGDGTKQPGPAEVDNAAAVRKSIFATAPIKAGDKFTPENIGCLRPGNGCTPMAYWDLLGQEATVNIDVDQTIEFTVPTRGH